MTKFKVVDSQCIVDDGEGNLYLCPTYKRAEAVAYFQKIYDDMADDNLFKAEKIYPQILPSYLELIPSLESLTFSRAVIE